jgi:hypothetical protein
MGEIRIEDEEQLKYYFCVSCDWKGTEYEVLSEHRKNLYTQWLDYSCPVCGEEVLEKELYR